MTDHLYAAQRELDDLDRINGIAAWPNWRPLAIRRYPLDRFAMERLALLPEIPDTNKALAEALQNPDVLEAYMTTPADTKAYIGKAIKAISARENEEIDRTMKADQ